jgi:hypothetical protein
MKISSLFQTSVRGFFVLGLVSILAACGGGGGGKKSSQVSTSASSINVSVSSSSFNSSMNSQSSTSSSRISSLNSSISSSVITVKLMGGAIQGVPLTLTGEVTTYSGTPPDADGAGLAARFKQPYAITSNSSHLFVADTHNHKVRKIEIATGIVTTLAGSGSVGSADGTGLAASFASPQGITTDGTHLYVADTDNHKIRKIEIATGVVTTLVGNSYGSANGIGQLLSAIRHHF